MQDYKKILFQLYELREDIMINLKTNKPNNPTWGKHMSIIDRNIKSIEKQLKNIFFAS